jgi:hypothetical protein
MSEPTVTSPEILDTTVVALICRACCRRIRNRSLWCTITVFSLISATAFCTGFMGIASKTSASLVISIEKAFTCITHALVTCRIDQFHWIITDIRIPIPTLRTCLVRNNRVRLGEVINIRRIPLSRTSIKKAGHRNHPASPRSATSSEIATTVHRIDFLLILIFYYF